VGSNGAGKTSILDGISFALFSDSESRGKKENLINAKAKKCKVTLVFTEAGVAYAVERSLERNRPPLCSFYQLVQGKKLIKATTARASDEEIRKVLGLDKNMFLQSVYVRQGEIEALVNAKPAERKELISKLLGVEDLERAWNGMKDVIEVYRDKKSVFEGALKRNPEVEKAKVEAESNVEYLEKQLTLKLAEKDSAESEVAALREKLELLDSKKSSFEKLDKQKVRVEQKIDGFQRELKSRTEELNAAVAAEQTIQRLEPKVATLSALEAYVSALSEKTLAERNISELDKQLSEINSLKEALKQNRQGYLLYGEAEAKLLELSKRRKEFEGANSALKEATRQLTRCQQQKERRASLLSQMLSKLSDILGEQISVAHVDDAYSKVKRYNDETVQQLEADHKVLLEKKISLEQRVNDLTSNLSKLSSDVEATTCPTCEAELTRERVLQLLKKYSEEKNAAEAQIAALNGEISTLERALKQEKAYGNRLLSVNLEELHRLSSELEAAEAELAAQRGEVERLRKLSESLAEVDEQISKLEEEKSRCEAAFKEYGFADKQLNRLPSEADVASERQPWAKSLEEIKERLACLVKELGYEPKDAKRELEELQLIRREYDQNLPVAKRKAEYDALVRETAAKLEEAQKEFSTVEREIRQLGYDEAEHNQVKAACQAVEVELQNLKVAIAGLEEKKSGFQTQLSQLNAELEALERTSKEKQHVEQYLTVLSSIRDAYGKDGIQKLIRARARPVLERATRDLFERFNLAYSDVKIDDDYNISVLGPAGEQTIEQISGGERVALAIALRLAIAQVLSGKVETVIMDEPTTHLDEERRKELVNILNSFFREGGRIIPQMLIITHHNEIQEVADVVYTVKKADGYSHIEALLQ
jgi:exonuclease SbcC